MRQDQDILLHVNPDLALSYVRVYDRDIATKRAKASLFLGAVMTLGSFGPLLCVHPDLEPTWIDAFGPDCMPAVQAVCIGLFTLGIIAGTAFIVRGGVALHNAEITVDPSVTHGAIPTVGQRNTQQCCLYV